MGILYNLLLTTIHVCLLCDDEERSDEPIEPDSEWEEVR
jgi:hypothetical protein